MISSARAIIIQHQSILLMHRRKNGQEYYTLPGGQVEPQETADQAATREVAEETSIKINNLRLVYIDQMGPPFGTQYVFVAEYLSGDVALSPDSYEARANRKGHNNYQPVWVPISKLAGLPLLPTELKEVLIQDLVNGWPLQPKMLTSRPNVRYT